MLLDGGRNGTDAERRCTQSNSVEYDAAACGFASGSTRLIFPLPWGPTAPRLNFARRVVTAVMGVPRLPMDRKRALYGGPIDVSAGSSKALPPRASIRLSLYAYSAADPRPLRDLLFPARAMLRGALRLADEGTSRTTVGPS